MLYCDGKRIVHTTPRQAHWLLSVHTWVHVYGELLKANSIATKWSTIDQHRQLLLDELYNRIWSLFDLQSLRNRQSLYGWVDFSRSFEKRRTFFGFPHRGSELLECETVKGS